MDTNATEQSLWEVIDWSRDTEEVKLAILILADFFEESGAHQRSTLLRMLHEDLTGSASEDLALRICDLCEIDATEDLIERMDRVSARLFACWCVEAALLDDSPIVSEDGPSLRAIRAARRNAFRLDSDEDLQSAQDDLWRAWTRPKFRSPFETPSPAEYTSWVTVRASGAAGRTSSSGKSDPHFDASLVARRSCGLNSVNERSQFVAAAQFYLLGRLVFESPAMKAIRREASQAGIYHRPGRPK